MVRSVGAPEQVLRAHRRPPKQPAVNLHKCSAVAMFLQIVRLGR